MDPIVWAIAFLVAAMILCFVEVFIPSIGAITATAVSCAIASCFFAFKSSSTVGAIFVPANILGMAVSFVVAFKLLPRSPLVHKKSDVEDASYEPVASVSDLVDEIGVAFTDLRPGGIAMIKDRKVDVVAEGGYIEDGNRIKVLRIEGTKVVVGKETI